MSPLIDDYLGSAPLYLVGSHKPACFSRSLQRAFMLPANQTPFSNDGEKLFHDFVRFAVFSDFDADFTGFEAVLSGFDESFCLALEGVRYATDSRFSVSVFR